jgi:hypothetical protein
MWKTDGSTQKSDWNSNWNLGQFPIDLSYNQTRKKHLMRCQKGQRKLCLWCYSECIYTPDKLEKYAWSRWELEPTTFGMPGIFFKLVWCGYTLRVTSKTSYSPEYTTPTQKKTQMMFFYEIYWLAKTCIDLWHVIIRKVY